MVLCSPGFLLIQEPAGEADKPRKLTDHELAVPALLLPVEHDARRRAVQAGGRRTSCTSRKRLAAQVRRMLADPKATGLVHNFTGQWLKVREFSGVITDRDQYRNYDDDLRDSSRREPYEFFKEVLATTSRSSISWTAISW